MKDAPFLSIILPTYNRLYSLRQIFLPSLAAQDFSDYELIVIDDAGTDGTDAYFQGKDFAGEFPEVAKRLVFIRNASNAGAPGSRNRGAERAHGEWLYVVEDDVHMEGDDFLSRAVAILRAADPKTGVVSPKRAEAVSKGYYHNPPRSFARIGWLSGEVYLDPDQEYSGFVPNTHASSFVRRDAYLATKEDEELFFGNTFRDESDLYLRIRRQGYKIWYCADRLKTVHRNDLAKSGGQKKVNNLSLLTQERMVWRNHFLYLRKNYRLAYLMQPFFVIVRMVKVASNLLRLPVLKNVLAWIRL